MKGCLITFLAIIGGAVVIFLGAPFFLGLLGCAVAFFTPIIIVLSPFIVMAAIIAFGVWVLCAIFS